MGGVGKKHAGDKVHMRLVHSHLQQQDLEKDSMEIESTVLTICCQGANQGFSEYRAQMKATRIRILLSSSADVGNNCRQCCVQVPCSSIDQRSSDVELARGVPEDSLGDLTCGTRAK